MTWKKLLDTQDLIAYEKVQQDLTVRIEARFKKNRWRVYKTHNFNGGETSHVKEYVASSIQEARDLVSELRREPSVTQTQAIKKTPFTLSIKRCYKEEFVEKWNFTIDAYNEDNFVIIRFDSEIKMDIVLHDAYNEFEKEILEELISSLGLKDISDRICYDFFYFKKHAAKRRVYQKPLDQELVAQLEFNIDSSQMDSSFDPEQ